MTLQALSRPLALLGTPPSLIALASLGTLQYRAIIWASEASPTLGCSIEISHDMSMYVGMYVYDCLWETYTKKLYANMHSPNMRMLKVRYTRIIHFY